jgi:hypothetical protein
MQSLTCPNCGAPLTGQSGQKLWLCIYCNTLLRVPADETQPTVEKTVSDAEMEPVKALLAEGKRDDAIAAYERLTGVPHDEAEQAIETLVKQYAFGIVRRQQLNGVGIVLVILYTLALPLSLIAWARGDIHPVFAILIAGFSALNLLVFQRAIRTMIEYAGAPKAKAIIQHYTQTSKISMRGGNVSTFKVLLEVQPAHGTPFQETMILPVREKNLPKMRQGGAIWVKYKPGEAGSLLFEEIVGESAAETGSNGRPLH